MCIRDSIGTIILSPGEQAVVSANGSEKRMVDLDEYVGWVDGHGGAVLFLHCGEITEISGLDGLLNICGLSLIHI